MKIRTRLTIYFILIVMALSVIRSLTIYYSSANYSENVFYNRLYAKALTTAKRLLVMENADSTLLARIDRLQTDLYTDENITVYDSTGHQIYTSNDSIYYDTPPGYFENLRAKKYIRYIEGPYHIVAFTYNAKGRNYFVTSGAISKAREGSLRQLRFILFSTLLFSLIIVVISGWLFVGRSLEPITAIIGKVKTLSPVEDSERLPVLTEKDEIAELVNTFNDLFDKLENSFKLQKHFATNVSHEINNPLTKIKSQLEVGLIQSRDSEDYRKIMRSILEDVNELSVLIRDLMNFSRVTQGGNLEFSEFRIDELMFEVRDSLIESFPDYKVLVEFTDPPQSDTQLICSGNKSLLITAIKNIIENACKYSPDQTAFVNLIVKGESLSLSINDHGPGIPPEELTHIFELFYRSPSMQSVRGFGIGLALSQQIFKAHNFPISVVSKLGEGTTFTIEFKK